MEKLENFNGYTYTLTNSWFSIIDPNLFKNRKINYLEIGTLHGANLISFSNNYGTHPDTKLFCIDPWEDYDDYPEYKNQKKILKFS